MIDNDLVCPGKCFNPLKETCCPTVGTNYDVCGCRISCFSNTVCADACIATAPKTTATTDGKKETPIKQATDAETTVPPPLMTAATKKTTLATASGTLSSSSLLLFSVVFACTLLALI
jgi:hypothetical protein